MTAVHSPRCGSLLKVPKLGGMPGATPGLNMLPNRMTFFPPTNWISRFPEKGETTKSMAAESI